MNFKYELISNYKKGENNKYLIENEFELHISKDKKEKFLFSKNGFIKKRTYSTKYLIDSISFNEVLLDFKEFKKTLKISIKSNLEYTFDKIDKKLILKESYKHIDKHNIKITKYLKKENKYYIKQVIAHNDTKGGYVYVLDNPLYENCYKVGKTKDLKRRVSEHNCSVPIDSEIIFSMFFDDYSKAEKTIQSHLNKIKREFYSNSLEEIQNKMVHVKFKLDFIPSYNLDIQKLLDVYFESKTYNKYFDLV